MTRRFLASALAAGLALGGCGEGGGGSERPRLTVSAAASLKRAFEDYAGAFSQARVRFSFAGSDELAAQIRRGVKPDVFAAANTSLPQQLFAEDRVERPVIFAGNRLVLAVPVRSGKVSSLSDLSAPGVSLVVGAASVPVGAYTREVLSRLPAARRRAILANVRSNEPDVAGVIGKLARGAADAGFVYATDVAAVRGEVRAVELPGRLRPRVRYAIAVVRGAKQPPAARAFIAGLLEGRGLAAMRRAGFLPPPG